MPRSRRNRCLRTTVTPHAARRCTRRAPPATGRTARATIVKAPPLNHASDWYLLAQLKKFKDGIRGSSGMDIEGAQMMPMANTLKDEQAMKDVVAHIATLRR